MTPASRNLITDPDLAEARRTWGWLPPEPRPEPQPKRPDRFMTTEQVAAALGVSKQRVAEIERSALAKLRAWLARRGLSLEDLMG
jgi:hypothetical protein